MLGSSSGGTGSTRRASAVATRRPSVSLFRESVASREQRRLESLIVQMEFISRVKLRELSRQFRATRRAVHTFARDDFRQTTSGPLFSRHELFDFLQYRQVKKRLYPTSP